MPDPSPLPLIAVVGATASGKSELAIELAGRVGGEIVNADAFSLYRGMDIGTAKVPPAERRGVPHHLIDVLDLAQEASIAWFQQAARAAIDDIAGRGRSPIMVGGSGLYVRAALDLLQIPPTDPAVRARLEAELAEVGSPRLHERLAAFDPVAASGILPGNGRRVVRALEVIEITGRPFTATLPKPRYRRPTVQVALAVPRPELDARIAARVERMWAAGFVAEVARLREQGLARARTASRALGYAQVLRFLAGECSEAEAREETVRATRRFARRQESWFRRDRRVRWLPPGGTGPVAEPEPPALVDHVLELARTLA